MPSVFGCIPSGSRYGNVPNELVHRAGPPFLDNHYRGYQWASYDTLKKTIILSFAKKASVKRKSLQKLLTIHAIAIRPASMGNPL